MPGSIRWLLLAFALVAATVMPSTTSLQAHAELDHTEPPADSVLAQAPPELTLYFAQAFVPASSWVMLRDAGNHDTELKYNVDPANPKVMHAPVPSSITSGVYTVRWQTLSADDDDYAQGAYKLTFGAAGGSAAAGDKSSSSGGASPVVYFVLGCAVVAAALGGVFLLKSRKGGGTSNA